MTTGPPSVIERCVTSHDQALAAALPLASSVDQQRRSWNVDRLFPIFFPKTARSYALGLVHCQGAAAPGSTGRLARGPTHSNAELAAFKLALCVYIYRRVTFRLSEGTPRMVCVSRVFWGGFRFRLVLCLSRICRAVRFFFFFSRMRYFFDKRDQTSFETGLIVA